jgi:hypothetical protein
MSEISHITQPTRSTTSARSTKIATRSAAKVPRHTAPRAAQASTRSRPALAHVDSQWCTESGVEALHPLHTHTSSLAAMGSKPGYRETGGGYTRGPMKVTPGNTHRQRKSVAGREPVHQHLISGNPTCRYQADLLGIKPAGGIDE